jgi:hypothetical protein
MLVVLGKREKHQRIWCVGFVSTKVCLVCYLHEHIINTKKTHDFIYRKGSFDRESLVVFWAKLPTKIWIGWKKSRNFCRHDQAFFFFLSRTKTGSILRCNSPSDCVEAFDHVCPPVSLGWVVVGVWTKMIGQLEGISFCSSKLEASQAFVQRLQLFLKMSAATSTFFISHVFRSKLGVADS